MYDIENYYNAKTVSEAVELLTEHPDARIISGGSDVLIKIREGRMAGTSLVSIRDIEELKGIEKKDSGDIYIGVGTVFSHITADPIIQECVPGAWGGGRPGRWTADPKYWNDWWKYLQRCSQCRQCADGFFL